MSAHQDAIGRPSASQRTKDLAFHLALLACLTLAVGLLVVLLVDVALDGAGTLTWDFINNFTSISADKAGIQAGALGHDLADGRVRLLHRARWGSRRPSTSRSSATPRKWWNRLIELNIQNLAAVPSIVYGILGLAFLVRGPLSLGNVVLAGGLTLALLVLPMVIIAGREALRAVPSSIREGSMALGATQWQTIWRQVLPAAVPGIATGVILALSRAIGETAPLIVVGAVAVIAFNPDGLDSQFTAMPIQIFDWISRASNDINNYRPLAAAGILLLMILLLAMNSVAIWLRNRYEQKW